MSEIKRIAFLIDDIEIKGGSQRISLELAKSLSFFYKVTFISWYKNQPAYIVSENVDYKYLLKDKNRFRDDCFKLIKNLKHILKEENINILIVVGRYAALITWFLKFNRMIKIIFWEQTSIVGYKIFYSSFKRKITNYLILLIYKLIGNKIVFLSNKDQKIYNNFSFLGSKNSISIVNYIDDELCKKGKTNYNINSKKIITVGRIDYAKGYEYLVKVAKLVFNKHPDWQWHIYGDGKAFYKNKIIDLIKENGIEKHVILQGDSSNIYALYSDYSFLVMTSRYEGFGLVLIEAKAKKLPLVSFDINSGPSDIIRDEVDGFLIKPFDCKAMADRICKLIETPELRQQFSDNANNNLGKFNKNKIVKQWCELINSL